MKFGKLISISLLATATVNISSVKAGYPLTDTLPEDQKIILMCSVDNALMAKDCGLQPGMPSSNFDRRTQAFIQAETNAPDYLAGATPGSHVLVMIRRSTAAPLDAVNPGRAAAPDGPAPPLVTNPEWALMPNPRDVNGYFPDRAIRTSTSGSAAIRCTVGARGDLLGCWAADEMPSGFGFAPAALRLTTSVQMKPTTGDGSPTVGRTYSLHVALDARSGKITLSTGQ